VAGCSGARIPTPASTALVLGTWMWFVCRLQQSFGRSRLSDQSAASLVYAIVGAGTLHARGVAMIGRLAVALSVLSTGRALELPCRPKIPNFCPGDAPGACVSALTNSTAGKQASKQRRLACSDRGRDIVSLS